MRNPQMKRTWALAALAALAASGPAAGAAPPDVREVPARELRAPDTVSPSMKALIDRPLPPIWKARPKSAAEWRTLVQERATAAEAAIPDLQRRLGVKVEPTRLGGVKAYVVTPENLAPGNVHRLLFHLHGGAYVFAPGLSSTREAILMAAYSRMKVVSIDYRMPPDFPYPAAMDDAMTAWKEVIKTTDPKFIGVFGTSTGGGMTLALVLRAIKEGVALPAATAPGTPWSDLTKTGDSYFTNEMVDNILVSYDGLLEEAARIYAGRHDLKDPQLSPVYGDYHGFPPSILTSGTRDLFLSNTVRVHRKMREAGVEALLQVFEGQSHAQYDMAFGPECDEYYREVSEFFDAHLAR